MTDVAQFRSSVLRNNGKRLNVPWSYWLRSCQYIMPNIRDVMAREGCTIRVTSRGEGFTRIPGHTCPSISNAWGVTRPALPLQLPANDVALVLKSDVDQLRNLAKSVIVE